MNSQKEMLKQRLEEKLERECGEVMTRALRDPSVIEILLNPDGKLWIDVAAKGMEFTGHAMAPGAAESVLTTCASMLHTTITRESPILEGEFPGFDQMRHHGLGASAEKSQQVVNQAALRGLFGDGGFEDVRVADFLHAAQRQFAFQPINGGLDGGIGGPAMLGKSLLDLADGEKAVGPERLHDLELELGEFWMRHGDGTTLGCNTTILVCGTQGLAGLGPE